jgi:hypothetical protein
MDSYSKSIEEYKMILKNQITEKGKSLDYVSGYVICLKEHNHLGIDGALEMLKYTSSIYFKKMGWK